MDFLVNLNLLVLCIIWKGGVAVEKLELLPHNKKLTDLNLRVSWAVCRGVEEETMCFRFHPNLDIFSSTWENSFSPFKHIRLLFWRLLESFSASFQKVLFFFFLWVAVHNCHLKTHVVSTKQASRNGATSSELWFFTDTKCCQTQKVFSTGKCSIIKIYCALTKCLSCKSVLKFNF